MRFSLPIAILVALIILGGASAVDVEYEVTANPHVAIPTESVEYKGESYSISSLGRVTPGQNVRAVVRGPSDQAFSIILFGPKKRQVVDATGVGNETIAFSTTWQNGSTYRPGTYVFAVRHEGVVQAITPVVISGYNVSLKAPDQVQQGSNITVVAEVETLDNSKPMDRVQIVIRNDVSARRKTLHETLEGPYTTNLSLESLPVGDYSVHVVVQGSQTALGRQEILGISDSHPLKLTESPYAEEDNVSTVFSVETVTVESTQVSSSLTTGGGIITPNAASNTASPTATPGQSMGLIAPIIAISVIVLAWLRRR